MAGRAPDLPGEPPSPSPLARRRPQAGAAPRLSNKMGSFRGPEMHGTKDTLAERLRRRPAKPMGSPRVGSNPTGVDLLQYRNRPPSGVAQRAGLCYRGRGALVSDAARRRSRSSGAARARIGVTSPSRAQPPPPGGDRLRASPALPAAAHCRATAKGARAQAAPRHGEGAQNKPQKDKSNTLHINHRSSLCSR